MAKIPQKGDRVKITLISPRRPEEVRIDGKLGVFCESSSSGFGDFWTIQLDDEPGTKRHISSWAVTVLNGLDRVLEEL